MQRFDSQGARIRARVAGGQELSSPEARLDIVRAWGEDGVVTDSDPDGDGVDIELTSAGEEISFYSCIEMSFGVSTREPVIVGSWTS